MSRFHPEFVREKQTHKHKYIEANGVRLHCVSNGRGRLILFLHGFPEFWYAWKSQLTEFGQDHRAAALDMRGFNLSDKPHGISEYRITELVEDIRAVGRHFSPRETFVLVGHDWGGYVAWHFASAYPETLQKLVIINAPHPTIFARLLQFDSAQQKASEYFIRESVVAARRNYLRSELLSCKQVGWINTGGKRS